MDTLTELLRWARSEHEAQKRPAPVRLHSQSNTDDAPNMGTGEILGGLPHSKAFERYLDNAPVRTPARQALEKMHAHGRKQSPEYLAARTILLTGDDPLALYSRDTVVRALSTLRELAATV